MKEGYFYDAFISYSHSDCGDTAPKIQSSIENIGKPWWKIGRSLNVYRDVTNLSANPHLWNSILLALQRSEYLILLASPKAAASHWVAKEVLWWLENRGPENLIIVLTSGFISWGESDFDWITTNSLPPDLKGKLTDEPVFVNIGPEISYKNNSDFKSALRAGCIKIVARITGKEPREVESEESIRKRNIISALSMSVVVLILALVFALLFFFDAKEQANRTQGLYLASESDKLIPVRGIQLLLSAWDKNKSDVVWGKLLSVFNNESILSHDINGETYAISPLYRRILILNDSNTIELRDYQGRKVTEVKHNKWITGGQFHPTQQLFLTCSSDSTAKVWTFGAKCVATIRHNEPILEAFISSGGRNVILSSRNHLTISDINGHLPKTIRIITNKKNSGFHNQFSSDGSKILVQGDSSIRIFSANGLEIRSLKFSTSIRNAKFSPISGSVVLIMNNGEVFKNSQLGSQIIYRNAGRPGLNIFHSPKENFFLSLHDKKIIFWDHSGKKINSYDFNDKIGDVQFSHDGQYCLIASGNSAILFDQNGREVMRYLHTNEVFEAKFSPDDHLILSGSRDRTACLWSISGTKLREFKHEDVVFKVEFLEKNLILTGFLPGNTRIWEIEEFDKSYRHLDAEIVNTKYRPVLKQLLLVSADSITRFFSESDSLIVKIKHRYQPSQVDFSSTGLILTSYSDKNFATLWDIHGREIRRLDSESLVTGVDASPNGDYFLTYDKAGTVKVWDKNGTLARRIDQGNKSFGNIIKSEFLNSAEIFTTYYDGRMKISRLNGGKDKIYNHEGGINDASINRSGDKLVSFSYFNYSIKVWDLKSNRTDSIIHTDLLNTVTFSPDGQSVLSASSDDTSRLWFFNKKAGNNDIILPHSGDVMNARFSPDGNNVLTYTDDGESILIWNLDGSKRASIPYQDVEIDKGIIFTPDSKKLVSINGTKVCFWDLNGSKVIETDVSAEILSVQFDNSLNSMFIITRQGLRRWIWPENVKTWSQIHFEAIPQLPRTIREHYEI